MLTRDEVRGKLKLLDVDITARTLRRYEEQKLISEATRGLPGLAGRSTRYTEEVIYEAYAAWALMNGYNTGPGIFINEEKRKFSPTEVCLARCFSLNLNEDIKLLIDKKESYSSLDKLLEDPRVKNYLMYISEAWKANIQFAKELLPLFEEKQ